MKTLRNQISNARRTHKETERVSDRYRKNGESFSEVLIFPDRTHRTYIDDIALELHAKFPYRVECLQGDYDFALAKWLRFAPELAKSVSNYVPIYALRINFI